MAARHSAARLGRARGSTLPRVTLRGMAIVLAGAALAFVSATHSLAQLTERNLLATLGAIGKHSDGALVPVVIRLAQQRGLGSPDRALTLAQETLKVAPLNPAAVRTAGLAFAETGRPAEAYEAMKNAVAMSRRDGVAQLWLINDAVQKREIDDILVHYDAVIRTLPAGARPLLLNLARTLVVPRMRREMRQHVTDDTPWFASFAAVSAENPATTIGFAQLLEESRTIPDNRDLREIYGTVVTTLAQQRQFELLQRLHPRLPGARAADLRTVALPPADAVPYPPVSWVLQADGSFGASRVGTGNEAAIELYAASGTGGVAASKLLILNPGRHVLRWRMLEAPDAADASARVQIRCASGSGESQIADAIMPIPADRSNDLSGGDASVGREARLAFYVGTGCEAVFIDLRVSGGTDRDESRWLIDSIGLAAASRGATAAEGPASSR